jgi:hypothetical protein
MTYREDCMRRWMRPVAHLTTAVGLVMAGALPALAATGSQQADPAATPSGFSFTIEPTSAVGSASPQNYISLVVRPGRSYAESVSVVNYEAHATTFWLYPADAYTISDGGGFAVDGLAATPRGVGAWVSPLPHTITVPGRRQLNIRFTVRIPANAEPGVHAGGIVVEDTVPRLVSAGQRVHVKQYVQVFTRLYVLVSGPLNPDFALTGFAVDHPQPPVPMVTRRTGSVAFTVANTGNSIVSPRMHVMVTGLFGTIINKSLPATGQVLPGDLARYRLPLPGLPALGRVHVALTVRSAFGITRTVRYSYLALPLPFIAAASVLIAGLALAILCALRRRRSATTPRRGALTPTGVG